MISSIYLKGKIDQMCLTFDCLVPDEAHKILDCLFKEEMDEILGQNQCDINLCYGLDGFRMNGDKKRWSHELVIFIETPESNDGSPDDIAEQLEFDRILLENIRHMILESTGIKEEE